MTMTRLTIATILYLIGVAIFFMWQTDFPTSKEEYMQRAHEANKKERTSFSDKTLLIGAFAMVGIASFGWPIALFVMPFSKALKE